MSSMISAQGVAVATAMAVSGTVFLLALRLQKSFPPPQLLTVHEIPLSPSSPILRSCISSAGKKNKKKKKRVHFAEDVVESCRNGEEFRKRQGIISINSFKSKSQSNKVQKSYNGEAPKIRKMPDNRVALYNGILRDRVRVSQRLAYTC